MKIAHQPGSEPLTIPEQIPNPAVRPAPPPRPEREPERKEPVKVPERERQIALSLEPRNLRRAILKFSLPCRPNASTSRTTQKNSTVYRLTGLLLVLACTEPRVTEISTRRARRPTPALCLCDPLATQGFSARCWRRHGLRTARRVRGPCADKDVPPVFLPRMAVSEALEAGRAPHCRVHVLRPRNDVRPLWPPFAAHADEPSPRARVSAHPCSVRARSFRLSSKTP